MLLLNQLGRLLNAAQAEIDRGKLERLIRAALRFRHDPRQSARLLAHGALVLGIALRLIHDGRTQFAAAPPSNMFKSSASKN